MKLKKIFIIVTYFLLISCQNEIVVDHTILSNCNIIDIKTGEITKGSDIWIDKDRIHKITPHNKNLTTTDTLIDATNKYVIPSLWDMHAHLVFNDWVANLNTAMGVTGLRSMHGGKNIEDVLKHRKDGFYKGFEFLFSSPITEGPGETWPGTRVALNAEEGRQLVREYHAKGYDFVKVYNFLSNETYRAIADECNKLDFPFAGHVPIEVTTEEAILAGQKSIEHTIGLEHALADPKSFNNKNLDYNQNMTAFLKAYDDKLKDNVLAITKSNKTWFCPTLANLKAFIITEEIDSIFRNDPRLKYIPKEEQNYWFGDVTEEGTPSYLAVNENWAKTEKAVFELRMSYLKPMLDNGTKFLAGTDIGNPNIYPGFTLHDELTLFVKAGFTELEALQTATLNPAIYVEREDELGTLEVGKIANILILDKNPLENIKNTLTINGLVRRGEYFGKDYLNKLLDDLIN
ncbi:amidohydrolase family protein [Tenacibaculum sp. S7007]|uniref:Amidohydrolase family protein n=1 Tax=Tenacibaculum pelagium TaxID=2759527 RepID=A0A839AQJ4_9FLAO|nr:amidohydrolase family protein [Tenacibaculum pelagium]MBA6157363.1 amidohydrolase family protein [Tenacibaculum pelagium]